MKISRRSAYTCGLTVALFVVFGVSAALAQSMNDCGTPGGTVTGGFINTITQTGMSQNGNIFSWMRISLTAISGVFYGLLGIQIIQDVSDYMLETSGSGSLPGFFTRYGKMLVTNGLLIVFFINSPTIIVSAFDDAAYFGMTNGLYQGTTVPPHFTLDFVAPGVFQPGELADQGACFANDILDQVEKIDGQRVSNFVSATFGNIIGSSHWNNIIVFFTSLGTLADDIGNDLLPNLFSMLLDLVAVAGAGCIGALTIWITFVLVAIGFAFLSIEVVFTCGIGIIAMGGLGHRALHQLPTAFLTRVFGLMMKVIALCIIIAMGQSMATGWAQNLDTLDSHTFILGVINVAIMSICYFVIAMKLPQSVELMFSGPSATGTTGSGAILGIAKQAAGLAAGAATRGVSAIKGGSGKV